MGSFADLEQAIKDLPDDTYRVFFSKARPAEEADIAALEARIGRPFPPELRKLYATWGILVVEVREEVWPRPKPYEVLRAWRHSYGFIVFGVGQATPPDLALEGALSADLQALGAAPLMRRIGTSYLSVTTEEGCGTWAPDGDGIEAAKADAIDLILLELQTLARGVDQVRAAALGAEGLMAQGRAARWMGSAGADVVDELVKLSPAELAPHVSELVDALLPSGRLSMGCLDILAVAGPAAFPSVADRVFAHYEQGDDQSWVLELLMKLGDTSPGAMAIYRRALVDDDVFEEARAALKAVATSAEARELVPVVESRLAGDLDAPTRAATIALLGHLGVEIAPRVIVFVDQTDDDEAFRVLLGELDGLPIADIAPSLLARWHKVDPKGREALAVIEHLIALGIEDRASMEPVLRESFLPRGGAWAKRAKAILDRW